jgi:hypothetical protein
MWCVAKITEEYRDRMYKILDLYEEKYNKKYPVVCIDEKSCQLLEEARKSIPMKEGSSARCDYEYKRKGTGNIFVAVEAKAGSHFLLVTERRTKQDFAGFVKILMDEIYPKALKVRLVLDNLNTHFEKSFYETFTKSEAKRILRRIKFYYTPKHASWLNMAEIEINMLEIECLARKIGSMDKLTQEVKAWESEKNNQKKKIYWHFTKTIADNKLSKYYVS